MAEFLGARCKVPSGAGSTGAAFAAVLRKLATSPVRILSDGEPLDLRWDEAVYLTGPAAIAGAAEFCPARSVVTL